MRHTSAGRTLGSGGTVGLIETELDEVPAPNRLRASKYDFLIEHIDGKVVLLPRGEIDGFGKQTSMSVIRAALGKWARSRGVKVELRYEWNDYRTKEPGQCEIGGKRVPWGVYVKVRSPEGKGPSPELLRLRSADSR